MNVKVQIGVRVQVSASKRPLTSETGNPIPDSRFEVLILRRRLPL
jgi:hypothetical protein